VTPVETVKIVLDLPAEQAATVLEAVEAALSREKAEPRKRTPAWSPELAAEAIKGIGRLEAQLLRRLVEAGGQRVGIGELARDFGLPKAAAPEHDFPFLHDFCAEKPDERRFPVVCGGEGEGAWYWMPVADAGPFLAAFRLGRGDGQPRAADTSE
jgi:hypothetical protein